MTKQAGKRTHQKLRYNKVMDKQEASIKYEVKVTHNPLNSKLGIFKIKLLSILIYIISKLGQFKIEYTIKEVK